MGLWKKIINIRKYRKIKVAAKCINVLGPISKFCEEIERSTRCKTDRVEIDLCEFKELTEQFIMMLRHIFNNATCNRRASVVKVLIKT